MKPELSLVTGAMDRPESFARLVDSIVRNTFVDWELVVSDASEVPLTCDVEQVRILPEKPRLGCVKGFNRAFREAQGEWVIYLNDDATVEPGYDVAAIDFMKRHPRIGLGALHYSEPNAQPPKPFHINGAWGVPYGNFGIIHRELGNHVRWFDEDLTMYGNDNSLALRVLLADYGIADIPDARVVHHSVKDQARIDNQRHRRRDNEILTEKYMPLKDQWRSAYHRHRVFSETEAWPHGVRPVTVTA